MTMGCDANEFHDLLDRWEDLRERGREPSVEELCRDAPHLTEKMREWVRVLKMSEWMCKRADDAADETFGEAGYLSAEERSKHQVIGEYTLLEELGGGGMGRVFRAVHRKLDRQVALKLLPQSLVQSPESVQRFHREVQVLARLSHPNIVAVHDAGTADGTHFYVMDLIEGDDLARLVEEHGPMPAEQALDCILQAARGLEYAHAQGIVHRDIKPSNLILDHDGTVKILDLGIARVQPQAEQAHDDLTRTGCVLGTVDYMPPEQALNTRRADHRADIYSLGCTLYYLLTGQPVYGGDTVMERLVAHREHRIPSLKDACPAAPEWLNGVFQRMVAKKPRHRYQSVTEVISALERHAAPRGRRWPKAVAAAAAVLILAGLAFLFHGKTTQNEPIGKTQAGQALARPKPDPEANLAAGKRLCFVENKWAEGLPLLAQCTDAPLRELAIKDLKGSDSARERLRLGDNWWNFAADKTEAVWEGSRQRAVYWYRKAVAADPNVGTELEEKIAAVGRLPDGFLVISRRSNAMPSEEYSRASCVQLSLEASRTDKVLDKKGVLGTGAAGLELKGVRFLELKVKASPELGGNNKNIFAGFMVDYQTAEGYTRRVALSIGPFNKDRGAKVPHWGKDDVPGDFVDLGRKDSYQLDLRQWAPPGWTGPVWFGLVLQQNAPNTFLKAELVPHVAMQAPASPQVKTADGGKRPVDTTETKPSPAKPKTNPADPEADLIAGKRLCFAENRWAEGLPLLARCSDARLRELATMELKAGDATQKQLRLGARWWDFAGNEVGVVWKSSQQRAAYWYRQAIPHLEGRKKAAIEKKLNQLDEQPPDFEVLARRTKVIPNDSHGSARCTNLLLEVSRTGKDAGGRNPSLAGLEVEGVGFLKVAVKASPSLRQRLAMSFVGFIVDYHVGAGYMKRVALSIGVFDEHRTGNRPDWGTGAIPDEYVDLGKQDEYELDLRKWAPKGWDGRAWFTLALQHAGTDTSVTAQLVPLAKPKGRAGRVKTPRW